MQRSEYTSQHRVADPIYALTVFFEEPVSAEDAADWAQAFSMMRNVMKVEKHV